LWRGCRVNGDLALKSIFRATFSRAWKLAADVLDSHIQFGSDGRLDDTKLMSAKSLI
jgi:hypothetical protein